ncbi:NAD(P)/FAD-dependent oxidoreductase [Candidatus Marinimicrobia bacterium]|nr:NAD(P)/FAD-dependent oxidoreductase [Candidatus Neomarinimicrobiota bacterium]
MKNNYDVIIVGGGPSASMCAIGIAKSGYTVCILEKDRDIGMPVRCGEAIGYTGLNQFFKPKDSWIASNLNSVKLVAPNGTGIDVDFQSETGYILNRRVFDYDLSRIAVENGAEVFTKSYVTGVLKEDDYIVGVTVNYMGEVKKINSKLVVGADGIESRVGRWAGIKTLVKMKDMESCVQYSVANIDVDINQMVMYVGSKYAPGGYLWIFPKGKGLANIGIGISGSFSKKKSAKKYLDEFINNHYPEVSRLTTVCGGVPCSKPLKDPIANGIMLIGDAAHQINPMTGGGIASGMKGGQIAGDIAVLALQKNNFSKDFLKKYPIKMFKSFGKNHDRFYRIKESINQLDDDDFNYIAEKVSIIPTNKRSLSSIFKHAVYKKPSLIIDVLKVFAGV